MCRGRESSSSVANKGKSGNWRQFSPALVNKTGRSARALRDSSVTLRKVGVEVAGAEETVFLRGALQFRDEDVHLRLGHRARRRQKHPEGRDGGEPEVRTADIRDGVSAVPVEIEANLPKQPRQGA